MSNDNTARQPEPNADLEATGKTALVHKAGEEGAITIDAMTGHVLVGQQDKPEWAQGLLVALLAERFHFYSTRLGEDYAKEHERPAAYDMQDLGWVAFDEEQKEVEMEADPEYRSEVIRQVLIAKGIVKVVDGEDVYAEGLQGVVMATDRLRTAEEASALEKASTEGFQADKKAANG